MIASAPPAIAIVVDRVPLATDVAPFEERGALLVPARAIFTALGAEVRYDPATGRIVASRGAHRASLTVGAKAATVDGRAVALAVPPRVVDARVLVPLRFVAEAFGGFASYDAATATVAIASAATPPPAAAPAASGAAPPVPDVEIGERVPAEGATVDSALPAISGVLSARGGPDVDPSSVRVEIDGVDETPLVRRTGDRFGFTPGEPLEAGEHEIDVDGIDAAGAPFEIRWSFAVAEGAAYEPPVMTLAPGSEGSGVGTIYDDAPAPSVGGLYLVGGGFPGAGGGPGNVVQFGYDAPPGGTGAISLCGLGTNYPLVYDAGSRRYLTSIALPANLYAPNCYVGGTFVAANGRAVSLPFASPIAIDTTGGGAKRVTPAPPAAAPPAVTAPAVPDETSHSVRPPAILPASALGNGRRLPMASAGVTAPAAVRPVPPGAVRPATPPVRPAPPVRRASGA